MAIAFYCEDEDPKVFHSSQGYYAAYGYNSYQQQQQSQHAAAVEQHHHHSQQPVGGSGGGGGGSIPSASFDENNNCELHGSPADGSSSSNGVGDSTTTINANRQLMRVLHQVLYRYTMEGALSPAHTSCVFCNKIYYLFQLLY